MDKVQKCPMRIDKTENPSLYKGVAILRTEYSELMRMTKEEAAIMAKQALVMMANEGEVKVPERSIVGAPVTYMKQVITNGKVSGSVQKVLFMSPGTMFKYTKEAMPCMERARQSPSDGDAAQRDKSQGMD